MTGTASFMSRTSFTTQYQGSGQLQAARRREARKRSRSQRGCAVDRSSACSPSYPLIYINRQITRRQAMKQRSRCAIYCRVSASGQDPTMQLRELREYCRLRGWTIHDEYIDRNISGAQESRPQLNRLMEDANRRRFDFVCVWKFDRFARSVSHLLRALETFRSLKIGFASLTEQIDTSTPAGVMVFTVLGAVSALERSLIAERVRAGLRAARTRGTRLGRPPLKTLSMAEVRLLRRERKRERTSFSALAKKYGTSTWTAFYLCKRGLRNV